MIQKHYYLTLDTETATLPFANDYDSKARKSIAIAKPLVYDIGWVITDRRGHVEKSVNYLVQETFFVPNIFNTAYYAKKRPIYMDMLHSGEITVKNWQDIIWELFTDLAKVKACVAYNAAFDFKKAIPFTESYITALYSDNYNEWEAKQRQICDDIANGKKLETKNSNYMTPIFELRGRGTPIIDLWEVACNKLLTKPLYKQFCIEHSFVSDSVQFFKTSAETAYCYLTGNHNFIESHTALDDAKIESEILTKALKRGKIEPQIAMFPFKKLGTTFEYVQQTKKPNELQTICTQLKQYIDSNDGFEKKGNYWKNIINIYHTLTELSERGY